MGGSGRRRLCAARSCIGIGGGGGVKKSARKERIITRALCYETRKCTVFLSRDGFCPLSVGGEREALFLAHVSCEKDFCARQVGREGSRLPDCPHGTEPRSSERERGRSRLLISRTRPAQMGLLPSLHSPNAPLPPPTYRPLRPIAISNGLNKSGGTHILSAGLSATAPRRLLTTNPSVESNTCLVDILCGL